MSMSLARVAILLALIMPLLYGGHARAQNPSFNATIAYQHVLAQLSFGPRIPGTPALLKTASYIRSNLTSYGWRVTFQNFTYQNMLLGLSITAQNLIATLPATKAAASSLGIVLGAHYDTRPFADGPNSDNRTAPVPGANDGASGVAVLLELGRVFGTNGWNRGLTMVFFDAEDSGTYTPATGWIQGSEHYVQSLNATEKSQIQAAIILDMIGYSNLTLRREGSSDRAISDAVWKQGSALRYPQFTNGAQPAIIDDHRPFLDNGIRAVDLIDLVTPTGTLDYPYWHTPHDTADKVSVGSLEAVGRTMEAFILSGDIPGPTLSPNFFIVLGGLIVTSAFAALLVIRARKSRTVTGNFTRIWSQRESINQQRPPRFHRASYHRDFLWWLCTLQRDD